MKLFKFSLLTLFTTMLTIEAFAEVPLRITPARVELNSSESIKSIRVSNETGKPKAYKIVFETRYMKPEGGTEIVDKTSELSASEMLRVSPRKIVIKDGERQTIRIQARRPKSLPEGDYFTHLKFIETALPKSLKEKEIEKISKNSSAGFAFDINTQINIAIPVTVSVGAVESSLEIQNARWLEKQGTMNILGVDVKRSGNGQGKGVLNILHKDKADTLNNLAINVPINVYRNLDEMTLRIPVRKDVPITEGNIHLSLKNTKNAKSKDISIFDFPVENVDGI